jgi:hypothetical protein
LPPTGEGAELEGASTALAGEFPCNNQLEQALLLVESAHLDRFVRRKGPDGLFVDP